MIQLPTAQQWMTKVRRTFKATDDMRTALDELIGNHFPVVPVIDERGCLIGILSEKDALRTICRWTHEGVTGGTVGDHMSPAGTQDLHRSRPALHRRRVHHLQFRPRCLWSTATGSSARSRGSRCCLACPTGTAVSRRRWSALRTAKSGHERPSTIADLQRTVASHTKEQLSTIFKHH
jgi:hypothetical protein